MKIMSRNFTTKEKVLLVLLAVMLVGLLYYRLVFVNISEKLISANAEAATLQSDLDIAQIREARIQKMETEMEGYQNTGLVSKMGSYNSSKPETTFLNRVLVGVSDYSITFDDVTRDGDQIRRNFNLQYKVPKYSQAEDIMMELTHGEYRCLVSDVNCTVDNNGATSVSLTGTFYETMVGGKADSALPKEDEVETVDLNELEYDY